VAPYCGDRKLHKNVYKLNAKDPQFPEHFVFTNICVDNLKVREKISSVNYYATRNFVYSAGQLTSLR